MPTIGHALISTATARTVRLPVTKRRSRDGRGIPALVESARRRITAPAQKLHARCSASEPRSRLAPKTLVSFPMELATIPSRRALRRQFVAQRYPSPARACRH